MQWEIESNRPIYTQLMEQIKARIISGEYALGSRLPSVRDLSTEAAVNPNTMQKALIELEREGLINTQRTAGRFITEDGEVLSNIKNTAAMESVNQFLMKMQTLGISKPEIMKLIEQHQNNEERRG